MAIEDAKAFLKRLSTDKTLMSRWDRTKMVPEQVEEAGKAGYHFTADELTEARILELEDVISSVVMPLEKVVEKTLLELRTRHLGEGVRMPELMPSIRTLAEEVRGEFESLDVLAKKAFGEVLTDWLGMEMKLSEGTDVTDSICLFMLALDFADFMNYGLFRHCIIEYTAFMLESGLCCCSGEVRATMLSHLVMVLNHARDLAENADDRQLIQWCGRMKERLLES